MPPESTDLLADLGITDIQTQQFDTDTLAGVTKLGDYLPRLQVMSSNTEIVKEGKIAQSVYALISAKDAFKDIGKELEVLFIAMRPKALNTKGATPVSYFDMKSDGYKEVQRLADTVEDSGCMYGPEFLVWIPKQEVLATFFCGSKSARKAAGPIITEMNEDGSGRLKPKNFTLRIALASNAKYKWQVPVATPLNSPIEPKPDPEKLRDELQKFVNPPAAVVEQVSAGEDQRAR